MPRSRPDLDVLLIGHGRLGEVGGVTTWARELVARSRLRIGAVGVDTPPAELPAAAVYHALTPNAAALAARSAHAGGRPLVLTCHAMAEPWRPEGWRGPLPADASAPGGHPGQGGQQGGNGGQQGGNGGQGGNHQNRAGYIDAEVIVAVGEAVAASHVAAGAPAGNMIVIPNGSPLAPIERRPAAEPVVGFLGRIAPVKGIERLMRAIRAVRAEIADARLVLVGPDDGPPGYAESLRRRASAPGLRGAVTFAGPGRAADWLPSFSCLALASETEGMPIAVLEAMAAGVPCVVPSVGDCARALGGAGIVVRPCDDDALAEALVRLLGDERLRRELAARAAARAAEWTTADVAAAYDQLYLALAR